MWNALLVFAMFFAFTAGYAASYVALFSRRTRDSISAAEGCRASRPRALLEAFGAYAKASVSLWLIFGGAVVARLLLDISGGVIVGFPWRNFIHSSLHILVHFIAYFGLAVLLWGRPWRNHTRVVFLLLVWLLFYQIESLVASERSPWGYVLFFLYPIFSSGVRSFLTVPGVVTHLPLRTDLPLVLLALFILLAAYFQIPGGFAPHSLRVRSFCEKT